MTDLHMEKLPSSSSPCTALHSAGQWGSEEREDMHKVTWLPGASKSRCRFQDTWPRALSVLRWSVRTKPR